jgi:tetratricopeptide (TPR) repeat protein
MNTGQKVFIPDQPADVDFLDFNLYVGALVDQVSSPQTQTPITLGIFGSWGSGKTTLMKLMEQELRRRKGGAPVTIETLWINVWQLSNQAELWNAFLQSLFNQVHANLSFWRRRVFNLQLLRERVDWGELFRQLLINSYRVIIVIIPLLVAFLWPKQNTQSQSPSNISEFMDFIRNPATGGVVTFVLSILLVVKPMVEAAKNKVSIDLKNILKDPSFKAQVSALQNLQGQFEKMVKAWVGNTGRIVIFIDDLDRCSPDKVTEVLEALKLFATTRGCIYVLGADQQVVARAIQIKYKELASLSSNEMPLDGVRYLEKIIQLPFLLPLVEVNDMNRYLNSFKIDWPHLGVVDSFSRGLPPNPRLIKRAVNVYLLLWRLAEQRKQQKKVGGTITPLRLAKVVSLQTAYPDAFEKLRDKPELLKSIEEFCQKSPDEQRASLQEPGSDSTLSELVKRPYVVGLFSLQNDDPLALFAKLNPADLRAFFSLAGQVAVAEAETLPGSASSAKSTADTSSLGISSISPAGNVQEKIGRIPPAALESALHQLPPPPRDYIGREEELEQVRQAVEQGASAILIEGLGGVGKTAFALKAAEFVMTKFPDAQLYINLRGNSERMLSPVEAMSQIVRAYLPTSKIPEDETELYSLYRSVLHNQRVLLVFDNAGTREQALPLVPPEGCLTIITSRQGVILPNQVNIHLDTLPPDDAAALLLRIAPRISGQAPVIAKLCGYLPLALRLAGSFIAERIDINPEEYAHQLSNQQQQKEMIDASISLSYAHLDAESQRLFSSLAVFADSFDREAASAVLDLNPDRTLALLSELVRYSLIEWDPNTGQYTLHNLVRLYARSRSSKIRLRTAQERHSTYYLNLLREIDEMYLHGGDAVQKSLTLFDLEGPNIRRGQEWAAKLANENEAAAKLCSEYPYAARHVLELRQHPSERLSWLEAALVSSRRLKQGGLEVSHLTELGVTYLNTGESSKAIELLQQALAISREIDDHPEQGYIQSNLGVAYVNLGDIGKAITFYEEALVMSRKVFNRRDESLTLTNLAIAYSELGEIKKAIDLHKQSLALAREIGDRRGEGQALGNLGLAYAALGDARRAIEFHTEALVISRELGHRRGEGYGIGNLGLAYADIGEARKAIECYEQQLIITREISDRRGESIALGGLGNVYLDLGETGKAIEYYKQYLAIAHEIGYRRGEGCALGNLGNAYAQLGETRKAIEYHEQSLIIKRDIGDRQGEGYSLGSLGNAYADLGETGKAMDYHEKSLLISREIGDRRSEGNTLYNMSLSLHNLGEHAQAIAAAESALVIFEQIESPHAVTVRKRLTEWRAARPE